jgi:hypothetical protein
MREKSSLRLASLGEADTGIGDNTMADGYTEFVNRQRERADRIALANQAQVGAAAEAVQDQSNSIMESNTNGYFDGTTFKRFFTFGVSTFGGPDVLK